MDTAPQGRRQHHEQGHRNGKAGCVKKRVADYGQVYTGKREINAMLDLVKEETERIESRFLEPACGTGSFLVEVLGQKPRVVESRYRKSQLEYERNAILAVSSICGIDILEDNTEECRKRRGICPKSDSGLSAGSQGRQH